MMAAYRVLSKELVGMPQLTVPPRLYWVAPLLKVAGAGLSPGQ